MKKQTLKFCASIFLFCYACLPISGSAVVYYKNDFESGTMPTFYPDVAPGQLWTLAPTFNDVYGPNNYFNISSSSVHNGNFSLRFTYEAKNGFCNTCGSKFVDHIKNGHDGVDYFIANDGADLSITDNTKTTKADDGPKAEPGKFVYDRDGGFSKWKIVSVSNQNKTNDRLNLKLVLKGMNGESTIKGGDSIAIARQCGVDGLIGIKKGVNDINRRIDCNDAIMWFAYVTPQAPGSSIFRRTYLKQEITSKSLLQKLHYLRPDRGGSLQGEVLLIAQASSGKVVPKVSGLKRYGSSQPIYTPTTKPVALTGLKFERSVWYYVEEQYLASTFNGTNYNNDGAYRLWFSKSGKEPLEGNPTFELTGLTLPPIVGGKGTHISFWGNVPHWLNARGSWYIDDVIISNSFNGKILQNGVNTSPPGTADTTK